MKDKALSGISPLFLQDKAPIKGRDISEHSQEIAKGTFWGFLGSGAFKIISFLYKIYVARAVSQGDVGLFELSLGIILLFGAWKGLGLPAALARYIPYYESRGEFGKVRSLLKWTYAINLVSGILLAALVWFCADFIGALYGNPALPEALRLLSFFVFLDNLLSTNSGYLNGISDMRSMQIVSNAQNTFKLIFAIMLFGLYGANFSTLAISFLLSYAAALILSSAMIYKGIFSLKETSGSISLSEIMREVVPFGLMISVVSVLWTMVSNTDRVVLGYFLPAASVNEAMAIYSFAVALGLNMMVFPSSVGAIFLPTISRLFGKHDMEGMRRAMATAQRWVLFITIPFAVVMIAFSTEMLSVFYGASYGTGGLVMMLFCLGLVFSVLSYVVPLALAGMRLVALEFKIALAVLIANIALCFILIPLYGMNGAAASSALSFALSAAIFLYYGRKIIGFETPHGIYRLLVSGFAVCVLLFLAKPAIAYAASILPSFGSYELAIYISKAEYLLLLGAASAASAALFVALALVLKCFEHEDVAVMKKVAKKAFMPEKLIVFSEKILLMGVEQKK